MVVTQRTVVIVDPAAEDEPERHELASRLPSLKGRRIGLIDNRKRNSDAFLQELQRLLQERYGAADFRYYRKSSASVPTPPEVLDDLAASCDAIVHAVAD